MNQQGGQIIIESQSSFSLQATDAFRKGQVPDVNVGGNMVNLIAGVGLHGSAGLDLDTIASQLSGLPLPSEPRYSAECWFPIVDPWHRAYPGFVREIEEAKMRLFRDQASEYALNLGSTLALGRTVSLRKDNFDDAVKLIKQWISASLENNVRSALTLLGRPGITKIACVGGNSNLETTQDLVGGLCPDFVTISGDKALQVVFGATRIYDVTIEPMPYTIKVHLNDALVTEALEGNCPSGTSTTRTLAGEEDFEICVMLEYQGKAGSLFRATIRRNYEQEPARFEGMISSRSVTLRVYGENEEILQKLILLP
jgi:hypothetical protein